VHDVHTKRGGGIEQIRLPMTDHALRYINAYLIEGDDGYTLVDCGWGLPDVLSTLERALSDMGLRVADVRSVIATHFHTDHYGMAGTIAEMAGAKVMMHSADWAILDTRFRNIDAEFERRDRWLERNGMSLEGYDDEDRNRNFAKRLTLRAPDRELADGDVLEIGSRRFRVVWTPGHTPGHVCLYDEDARSLISGDHILPQITPHIGYWSDLDEDPLGKFLASLHKVAALGAKSALPAHREPIDDLPARVEELIAHHHEREAQVLAVLDCPSTGTQIAAKLPWRRNASRFADLPPSQRSFALVETLAHLEHLRARGAVYKSSGPDVIRYEKLA
jgi:glyoxylase-like metal-dependent hydrolase (beta-lactamase superfamily II)